jgi:two-component system response regulator YesN
MLKKPDRSNKKNRLYLNIFMILTLTVVLTIFTISTVLYFNFEKITLGIVYSDITDSLRQTSSDTNKMAKTGITLVNQISRDLTIAKLLYYNELNIYELQPAITQLQSYSQVMQFINSVYIYNSQINVMYVASREGRNNIQPKDTFDDRDAMLLIENYHKYKPFSPIPRQFSLSSQKETANCYTFLGYNWLDGGNTLRCAVIVNISEEWLHDVINSGRDGGKAKGDTFILDSAGKVISNSSDFPMLRDLSDLPYIRDILAANINGYTVTEIDGVKSLVAYTAPDSLDWRYVRIVPYDLITADINEIKKNVVIFSLFILIFGFVFSVIASRILFKPIKRMRLDLDLMEDEMKNSYYILKQDFLRKVLFKNTDCDIEDIPDKFRKHRINLGISGRYFIAILKIDHFSDFLNANRPDERGLIKFAIMNIASETCSQKFRTESVDMNDDSMILLLNNQNPSNLLDETFFSGLFSDVQNQILKHLGLSITVTISPEEDSIGNLGYLYSQTAEASLHRLFYGHGSIIFVHRILEYDSKEYTFPAKKEQEMLDAIMKGEIGEARRIYMEIMAEVSEYPFAVVNIAISRLALTVNTALNTLKRNHCIAALHPSGNLLFFELTRIETIEEIHQRFFKTIDYIFDCIREKKKLKHDVIIEKINSLIDSKCSEQSLSLDSIADSLAMSPAYIGRLYKQYTSKTILERITDVRMERARTFLVETEYPIARIAELTGFSDDSYFYKTFKKENGITPADYRKNNLLYNKGAFTS